MYGAAIVFLIVVAIFGLNVFRVIGWLVFGKHLGDNRALTT
jgi:hypothetical protein